MIRQRAAVGDILRCLLVGSDAIACLPPGTVFRVHGHMGEPTQRSYFLAEVLEVPLGEMLHIVVPKGTVVEVHEE